jgi:flagellar biogenesis protein FliO
MDVFYQSLAILAVFALLAFILWWLKKKGAVQMGTFLPSRWTGPRARGGERLLERVDGLQLSPTHSLNLIRMADRAILIGISPSGFCLVESSPWKSVQTAVVDLRQAGEKL